MNKALLGEARKYFNEWQKSLVAKNSKADRDRFDQPQQELQLAITGGVGTLSDYLRRHLSLDGAEIKSPPFPRTELTPAEFHEPPRELENELIETWKEQIQPAQASQPLFWLLCHIAWLEQCRFGADSLASSFTASATSLDDQTRSFLRRTGGLPHIRGNTSVFSDCPLARAWWRCRIVSAVVDDAGGAIIREDAHRVLHDNRPAWETLVMLSLRRITVINQPSRARGPCWSQPSSTVTGPTQKAVQRIATALARHGLNRSLEHTPWAELEEFAACAAGGAGSASERLG